MWRPSIVDSDYDTLVLIVDFFISQLYMPHFWILVVRRFFVPFDSPPYIALPYIDAKTCVPLSLILDESNSTTSSCAPIGARCDQRASCPGCNSGAVLGFQVLPLSFTNLKRAIDLRVDEAATRPRSSSCGSSGDGDAKQKRERDDEVLRSEAEHEVYSQGCNSDRESRRTGRWTNDEVTYSDELIRAFDNGQLPLAHGTKLATFLGDALLCKASRLTKKMKNAKLSTRSFEITRSILQTNSTLSNREPLCILQDRFVASMNSEYMRLELGFHLSVHWRMRFSELCVQIGYPFLDSSSFISSLEEYERLGDNMRNVRRRKSVDISTVTGRTQSPCSLDSPTREERNGLGSNTLTCKVPPRPVTVPSNHPLEEENSEAEELFDDSLGNLFEEDCPPTSSRNPTSSLSSHNPFMEVIANYLEAQDLPFQHADTWVPSCVEGTQPTLIYSGAVTRRDQDGERWSAFESFGKYSSKFSFSPGKGLVGRVFSTGKTMWEYGINKLDPKFFLRAGGAEEYGVRTAVGIPLSSMNGRMVVVLYSCNHIPEDLLLANQFEQELSQYAPVPKWKLVVDIKNAPELAPVGARMRSGSIMDSSSRSQDSSRQMNRYTSGEDSSTGPTSFVSPPVTPRGVSSVEQEESEIVACIGDHLASDNVGMHEDPETFHNLLRMRLMLLRPASRRSAEENEKMEIIRASYKSYSCGGRFSNADLLRLLAQEWKCLLQFSESLDHHVRRSPFAPDRMVHSGAYQRHDMPTDLGPTGELSESALDCEWDFQDLDPKPLKSDDTVVLYDHSLNSSHSVPPSKISFQSTMSAMPRSVSSSTTTTGCDLNMVDVVSTAHRSYSFSGGLY